jgi:hypothetical protein
MTTKPGLVAGHDVAARLVVRTGSEGMLCGRQYMLGAWRGRPDGVRAARPERIRMNPRLILGSC